MQVSQVESTEKQQLINAGPNVHGTSGDVAAYHSQPNIVSDVGEHIGYMEYENLIRPTIDLLWKAVSAHLEK